MKTAAGPLSFLFDFLLLVSQINAQNSRMNSGLFKKVYYIYCICFEERDNQSMNYNLAQVFEVVRSLFDEQGHIFICASISSTYPSKSVRWSVGPLVGHTFEFPFY